MNKRGQEVLGMSFGMIFSIILIIAIIGVSFYAITYFLNLNKCTKVGFFFQDIQEQIDSAWTSDISRKSFNIKQGNAFELPKGITNVCFGTLSLPSQTERDNNLKNELDFYNNNIENNVFLYPTEKACNGELFTLKIEHFQTSNDKFFCVQIIDNKLEINLRKDTSDSLVKLFQT